MSKTSEILEKCGFRRIVAATLGYLIDHQGKTVTLRDVELETGCRQPEVSIAMSQLIEKRWVTATTQPLAPGEKGRKINLYRLIPVSEIYLAIEREQLRGLQDVQKNLAMLKKAMRVVDVCAESAEMMAAKPGQPDSTTEPSAPVTISGDNSPSLKHPSSSVNITTSDISKPL